MENRPDRKILKRLCREFLDAALTQFELEGEWPLPHHGRVTLQDQDLSFIHWNEFPEFDRLTDYFVNDPNLVWLYSCNASSPDARDFLNVTQKLLVYTARDGRSNHIEDSVFNSWFTRFERELYAESSRWRTSNTVTGLKVIGTPLVLNKTTKLTSQPGYRLAELADGQHIDFSGMGLGNSITPP